MTGVQTCALPIFYNGKRTTRIIQKIERKEYFDGLENYIDYLYEGKVETIFDYLNDDAIVYVDDVTRCKERVKNLGIEFKDNYTLNLERGLATRTQGGLLYSFEEVICGLEHKKTIFNTVLPKPLNDLNIRESKIGRAHV